MREEKVSLGITTLLSMSILMLMVSDQMPTTSTFIPLIGLALLGTQIYGPNIPFVSNLTKTRMNSKEDTHFPIRHSQLQIINIFVQELL